MWLILSDIYFNKLNNVIGNGKIYLWETIGESWKKNSISNYLLLWNDCLSGIYFKKYFYGCSNFFFFLKIWLRPISDKFLLSKTFLSQFNFYWNTYHNNCATSPFLGYPRNTDGSVKRLSSFSEVTNIVHFIRNFV